MKRGFLSARVVVILAALTTVAGFYVASCTGVRPDTTGDTSPARTAALPEPFYGMVFVDEGDLGMVKDLGIEVVQHTFAYDGTPENWLAFMDAAQAQDIKVIAWLWPEGWEWDGTTWQIDSQAQLFIQTVRDHPALFAIYAMNEAYWRGCRGCGYTTAQLQELYNAIKAVADVPIYTSTDSMSFSTAQGEETAFADGVGDYCETWYYPFEADGSYRRDELISRLTADLAVARERAPNTKIVWKMQGFARNGLYRMPTTDEMRDLASIVYSAGIDGALWYLWATSGVYGDVISNHPELHPMVREIYDDVVLPTRR